MNWLEAVFDRYTRSKSGNRRRRLLIVDGHSSHVNMAFIELADCLRIILVILPPHSTHRLQPLDKSLFAPLARYYTNGLNSLLADSLGMISMSKRAFFKVFWPAWQQAFSVQNIKSGFRKTGIWPMNAALVIDEITIPQAPPVTEQEIKTPLTCRTARHVQCIYTRAPTSPILAKILWANLLLAAQHSINKHIQKGLVEALKQEKKRRQRGKRLNLIGEEDSGPQLFSPTRVQAARDYQTSKETEEADRQQGIADRKVAAAAKKAQKEKNKKERAVVTAERRRVATEVRAQKAAEKQAL